MDTFSITYLKIIESLFKITNMAFELTENELNDMTITQKEKLLDDLQIEKKKRMKEHIKPAIEQYIKPIQKRNIEPLKNKYIKTIDNLTRMIKKKLPEKKYVIICEHCTKTSRKLSKKDTNLYIKQV